MPAYPTYKLGEVIDKVTIVFKVKQKEYLADGKFPIIDQGQNLIGGYTNDEKLLVNTEFPVIVFGDHTKVKKYIDFPFVAGADGTKIIKPKKEFFSEPKLFYYFLHCLKLPDKGYARHFQYLLKSDISIPPLATQHAIVTRIESLFAELDKGVEKLKTAQQQLKVYRQAVLNDCLTKGSEKWEKVKLGEVIEKPTYGTSKKCDYGINGTGVLRIPNIGDGYIVNDDMKFAIFSEEEKKKYSLKNGDLLTIRSNGSVDLVGKCALITLEEEKYLFAGYLIRLRPNNQIVESKYLLYVLMSHNLRVQIEEKAKSTSGVNNINSVEIQNLQIVLPSLPEQQRIVQEIETRLSACDEVEKNIAESLQQAEALRQSILKKAFEGELV